MGKKGVDKKNSRKLNVIQNKWSYFPLEHADTLGDYTAGDKVYIWLQRGQPTVLQRWEGELVADGVSASRRFAVARVQAKEVWHGVVAADFEKEEFRDATTVTVVVTDPGDPPPPPPPPDPVTRPDLYAD